MTPPRTADSRDISETNIYEKRMPHGILFCRPAELRRTDSQVGGAATWRIYPCRTCRIMLRHFLLSGDEIGGYIHTARAERCCSLIDSIPRESLTAPHRPRAPPRANAVRRVCLRKKLPAPHCFLYISVEVRGFMWYTYKNS